MRRPLRLVLAVPAAAVLGLAAASGASLDRRITHPDGLVLVIQAIERRSDSIVLSATIGNPGDRDIVLDRARSLVLDEGDHALHYLNPPPGNPELRVAAHAQMGATLVFIGPAAPATRQLTLSANEGIGTPDNPYDTIPALKATLPLDGDAAAAPQATHPDGVTLRVARTTAGPADCLVVLRATNGNDRAIRLNQGNSLVLADRNGLSAPVEAPADNPELVVPPGHRLDAELRFRCARLAMTDGLMLTSNEGTGGTRDNPYATAPVFTLPLQPEIAGPDAVLAPSHAAVAPIAHSELSPAAVAAAAPAPQPALAPAPDRDRNPALKETRAASPAPASAAPVPAPPPNAVQLEGALHATRTDRGLRIVLSADELFGAAGDTLDAGAEPLLQKLDALIAATHPREIDVAGHTDSNGEDADNLKLSEERAHAIAAWLEQHSPKRRLHLVEKGYGRTRPVEPNHNPDGSDNPDGRARNRRVEVLLRR